MKNKSLLKVLFLSLLLSSCGLFDRFKTPEQSTDSTEMSITDSSTTSPDATDDLFSKTLEESNQAQTDNPSNLSMQNTDPDLQALESEFSSNGPNETAVKESEIALTPDPSSEAPVVVQEALPEIKPEIEKFSSTEEGSIQTYKVKKGETLMQIAFKIYGDISKWKDIKNMNPNLENNSSLRANTELKYRAPASAFVWNPAGSPYLIKNGETLGTISNSVYATPKKWKSIWENNKPLIKNPNVIYAGFTLYYTKGEMANYVQPKSAQPKKEVIEEVVAEQLINNEEVQVDKAVESLAAPTRTEELQAEVDLINNVTAPTDIQEIAPDIDEEIQTL